MKVQGTMKEETQIQSQWQGLLRPSGKHGLERLDLAQSRMGSPKGGPTAESLDGEEMLKALGQDGRVKNLQSLNILIELESAY